MPILLLLFIVVPIVELTVIGSVSGAIGIGWTLLLLLVDSLIGAILVRREGARAWHNFVAAIGEGRWPGDEVMQGALVLVGGALLVTPGFVTDVTGLLMVLPPSRAAMSRVLRHRFTPPPVRIIGNVFGAQGRPGTPQDGPQVYDAEVLSVERETPPTIDRPSLDRPDDV